MLVEVFFSLELKECFVREVTTTGIKPTCSPLIHPDLSESSNSCFVSSAHTNYTRNTRTLTMSTVILCYLEHFTRQHHFQAVLLQVSISTRLLFTSQKKKNK